MIAIVFDSPPGSESQFVEVERDGKGINFGEWEERADGYWSLNLVEVDHLEDQLTEAKDLYEIAEEGRSSFMDQLVEAQQTIRMAYSDLPDKKYDAEATLEGYMTRHNLEEW